MNADKILTELKNNNFKTIYWLEGEEEFFIDKIINYAEHNILNESEAGFNLSVFYGRDADWTAVINACRRYPMFAERQVIVLKEAQEMKSIDKLEAYIEKPLSSTLLFIAYKHKKVDGRTKLAKTLKEKGVLLTTKKLYDNELPDWTLNLVKSKGYTITTKALLLLIDHIGNDLSRMSNEIDKLTLNLAQRKDITEDDIENFVGVSKEFNVFELQHAIGQKDFYKAIRIVNYFEANPKAAPLQLVFPSLYNFFSKVNMIYSVPVRDDRSVAAAISTNAFFVKDYISAATKYSQRGVEKVLLLLHHYNLKAIGINDAGTTDGQLLKEMIVKIMAD